MPQTTPVAVNTLLKKSIARGKNYDASQPILRSVCTRTVVVALLVTLVR